MMVSGFKIATLLLATGLMIAPQAKAMPDTRPPDADALTAEIHLADAERFVRLFTDSNGQPTTNQLQEQYLGPGSHGISVFTPNRIIDAENLRNAIVKDRQSYAKAIDQCLPVVRAANSDLRSIYLGIRGALPDARLPQVYVLFGAGNSGGTAAPGAQVLGLEKLCEITDSPDDLRKTLRHFFAHETVHALQEDAGLAFGDDALLHNILAEGAADFIARLVTGEEPDPTRATWAETRESELWEQFQADIDLIDNSKNQDNYSASEKAAFKRWIGNYSNPPDDWPGELGYWMGMRIWERYYAATPDKQVALQDMLSITNPRQILKTGSFVER